MRVVIITLMFLVPFMGELKASITLLLTILWFIYAIYLCSVLFKLKDSKIISNKCSNEIPNILSSSHLRYFYKRKIDNKIFILIIFELLVKKSISLVRKDNEYYFVDNKIVDEILSKSEENVKKILFTEIGNKESVSLTNINLMFRKNSGYMYHEYKLFNNTFEIECAREKYFKSNKNLVDGSSFYLLLSLIISIYNLFFTKYIFLSLIIFIITISFVLIINNFKNIEDDRINEYKSVLEFRNYICDKNSDFKNIDIETLESYALYSYALDSFEEFKDKLFNKYVENEDCLKKSILLSIINIGIFDVFSNEICKSIDMCTIKGLVKKNKGRRV